MDHAHCACGALKLTVSEPPKLTALCHCLACQRRTGAAFSCNAFYAIECVDVTGLSSEFTRIADSGRKVCMHFCPRCGSTVSGRPNHRPPGSALRWVLLPIPAICRRQYRSLRSRGMPGSCSVIRSLVSA